MNFLIFIGLVVLVMLIGAKLGDAVFQVYDAICRFLTKPPRVVIPGVLAWAAAFLLLLFWFGH